MWVVVSFILKRQMMFVEVEVPEVMKNGFVPVTLLKIKTKVSQLTTFINEDKMMKYSLINLETSEKNILF